MTRNAELNGTGSVRAWRVLLSLSSTRVLITLPLLLAAFALILHLGSGYPSDVSVSGDIITEDYFRGAAHSARSAAELIPGRKTGIGRGGGGTARRRRDPLHTVPWSAAGLLPGTEGEGASIAFCATASEPLSSIRLWLNYARALGVSRFYLFTEGRANLPDNQAALRAERGVTVIPNDDALRAAHASSRIWDENWLSSFFHKPCNYELFVRQSLNMEIAIARAREDGVAWLLHIDTDELLWPGGGRDYSLQTLLGNVSADVDVVVFPNYEALPERGDVREPFLEVSLFKRNFDHVDQGLYFSHYRDVTHGNENYFLAYGNGKAAARVVPGLRPNGAHRWQNYDRRAREITLEQAAVLHYTYNRFSDLKGRRDRCDCAPNDEDAKRCFILPFDRSAYLASSLMDDEQLRGWFNDHLVWDHTDVVSKLLHKGLFVRLYEPQVMMRGFIAAAAAAVEAEGGNSTEHVDAAWLQQLLSPPPALLPPAGAVSNPASDAASRAEQQATRGPSSSVPVATVGPEGVIAAV